MTASHSVLDKSQQERRVVITGAAISSPAGYTLAENSGAWWNGHCSFTEITAFSTKGSSVRYAGQCKDPDVKRLPDRKVQKILRRKDVISLLTTIAAAENAKIFKGDFNPDRAGMYVGAGSTQIGDLTPYFTLVAECADTETGTFDSAKFGRDLMNLVNPLVVLQTLMNNGLCFGTMTLDIRGVNCNFMDFQVAGLRALGEGFRSIQVGRADIVIAGGVSGPVEPFQLAEGVRAGFLARTSDYDAVPADLVKPWDADRCGSILSEGSAYVVLESEEHAVKRGANILGRISGYGLSNDGSFEFMREKEAPGLVRALNGAVKESAKPIEQIGGIVGHGNGALSADRAEAHSYLNYLGQFAEKTPITSAKSVLGDMGEAGGVTGVIMALDILQQSKVPATWNFCRGDELSSGLKISGEAQELQGDCVVVTSRNFLGLSGALVVERP